MSLHLNQLAKSLCSRIPHNTLEIGLKEAGIRSKRGIQAIEDSLIKLANSENDKDKNRLLSLDRFYRDYLEFGDKTVSIANIDTDLIDKLESNIGNFTFDLDKSLINFPYIDEDTDQYITEAQSLVDINVADDGILFTFTSLKSLEEKIKLDAFYFQQLNEGFTLPPELYDITAKRHIKRRYYDSIFVRKSDSTIEFKLDTASLTSQQSLTESLYELKDTFLVHLNKALPDSEFSFNLVNLFLAIPGAYNHTSYRVCELGFSVGSVTHHEKMRSSNKDLRNEKFHQGGKNSIKDTTTALEVFRIAVRNRISLPDIGSYETEAYLPGVSKMIQSAQLPLLEYVIISNCIKKLDYNKHITSIKSDLEKYTKSLLSND